MRAVGFCTLVTAAICLINIGSTVAFNAIVSLTLAGLYISYLIPISLRIIHRLRKRDIKPGIWSMGPAAGLVINVFSVAYLTLATVFSFFPPGLPVGLLSMNWSCLVFGGGVLIGLVYYAVKGRKVYDGPIWEL